MFWRYRAASKVLVYLTQAFYLCKDTSFYKTEFFSHMGEFSRSQEEHHEAASNAQNVLITVVSVKWVYPLISIRRDMCLFPTTIPA